MNIYFWIAAGLAALIGLIHLVGGGKTVAKPFLTVPQIDETVKYTQYYAWHLVTISLFAGALGYAYAAIYADETLGGFLTLIFTSYALLGLVMPKFVGQTYVQMPQGYFFLPVTIVGILGIIL